MVRGDWDVAVWPDPGERYADLVADLAKALGASEEEVDVVVISDDLPCPLALEFFKGRLVNRADLGEYLDLMTRFVGVCTDFMISRWKVGVGRPSPGGYGNSEGAGAGPRLVHGGAGDLQPGGSERSQEVFRGPVPPPVAEPGVDRHGATRRRVAGDFA